MQKAAVTAFGANFETDICAENLNGDDLPNILKKPEIPAVRLNKISKPLIVDDIVPVENIKQDEFVIYPTTIRNTTFREADKKLAIKDEVLSPENVVEVKFENIKCEKDSRNDIKTEEISDLLQWKNGLGTLEGSKLKFRFNEFNAIELIEDKDLEDIKKDKETDGKVESSRPKYTQPHSQHTHHARKPKFRDFNKEDPDISSDQSLDSDQNAARNSRDSDDICCCKNCGCYGLSSEFYRENSFCSIGCGEVSKHTSIFFDF